MAQQLGVMVCAVVLSVALMLFVAKPIGEFVDRHPTLKVLALSFLLLIGTALVADGFEHHVPKGYLYSAMGFSVFVESLNLRLGRKAPAPVQLHERIVEHAGS
jgi:predicted tellurium resistance membrane protein TerC